MPALTRILKWAFVIGFITFAAGFFGPIIFAPDANQGPLLGIFITGPLGFLAGIGVGVWKEVCRVKSAASAIPSERRS